MESLKNYKNEKVLITGNTGFKGSWLSLFLQKLGARVYGYALEPPTIPSMYDSLELKNIIEYPYYGDIRDRTRLDAIIEAVQPKFIFHLAAQPIVKTSYEKPIETFEINSMGTLNLMEIAKNYDSIKSIVVITTDKVYEDKSPYIYSEFDSLGGDDPYSASKACAELIVNAYKLPYKEKGISLATCRAGNVIAGGDFSYRIVPQCVESLYRKKPFGIWYPEAIRPWQFVLDCLHGYLLVGINQKSGAWNFGPVIGNRISVDQLTQKIIKCWGQGESKITLKPFYETKYLQLKTDKATNELWWKPKYDIDKTVEKIVEWYKTFYEHPEDLYSLTCKQLDEFMEFQ